MIFRLLQRLILIIIIYLQEPLPYIRCLRRVNSIVVGRSNYLNIERNQTKYLRLMTMWRTDVDDKKTLSCISHTQHFLFTQTNYCIFTVCNIILSFWGKLSNFPDQKHSSFNILARIVSTYCFYLWRNPKNMISIEFFGKMQSRQTKTIREKGKHRKKLQFLILSSVYCERGVNV